jgi:tetratricopeptide (TPR) repeat protein
MGTHLRGCVLIAVLSLGFLASATVSANRISQDAAILFYQRKLQRSPHDALTYFKLGDAYIQKARENGDIAFVNLAEQALQKSLELDPQNSGALRHLAYVLYYRHAFEDAAIDAGKAVKADPTDGNAYGIMGDAYQETGKYRQARQAYQAMMKIKRDLYAYSRSSGSRSLRGDTQGAMMDLEKAIREGKTSECPSESIAWVQWQLANEYFALGKIAQADFWQCEALKTYPDYFRALAGLAQVRTAQQRFPEAIELYKKAIAIIPFPEYATALGDIYLKIGQVEESRKQFELVEYIGQLNTLNKILYNRGLAYFYADHDIKIEESLKMAKEEFKVRKDIYGYDVLAWTLYKNGSSKEAAAAVSRALELGTKDANLFFHAGMIYHRLGDTTKSRHYLRRALLTNPHFHIFHADVARTTLKKLDEQPSRSVKKEESGGA